MVQELRTELSSSQQKADRLTKIVCAHRQKHQCETLYADGNIIDAVQILLEIVRTASDEVKADTLIGDWLSGEFRYHRSKKSVQFLPSGFTNKCVMTLENIGDEASEINKHDEALAAYSTALFLGPSTLNRVLIKWANTMLLRRSTNEALDIATKVSFT